jgi:hypothetical protein
MCSEHVLRLGLTPYATGMAGKYEPITDITPIIQVKGARDVSLHSIFLAFTCKW